MYKEHHHFDVCVIGGGMSGLCAAVASARNGRKTCLVQDRPVLGGNASSEIRMHICGAHGPDVKETGILEEVQLANVCRNPDANYAIWDSVLWEAVAFQPNLQLFLNCSCIKAHAEGPQDARKLLAVECWELTSQTMRTFEADLFIDCSGDSILADDSGAEYRWGRESRDAHGEDIAPSKSDRRTMGNSLLIQYRMTDQPQPFTPPEWAYKFESEEEIHHRVKGVNGHNFWWLELGGFQDTIRDTEAITRELYRVAWGVWDYLKNRAPNHETTENWALEFLGTLPGKRENRRYMGAHILTQHDIRDGGKFDDLIAYGGWSMDDHHPAGLYYPGAPTIFHPAPTPYGIPYRSLYSRNVTNLMFAGRNISTTHAALSSTRVMATCAIIGQAAGTAAALAHANQTTPAALFPERMSELQQILMEDDCYLPGFTRTISGLVNEAKARPDAALFCGQDRKLGENLNGATFQSGDSAEFAWNQSRQVNAARLVFDSNLSNRKMMPFYYKRYDTAFAPPSGLVKSYRIEARRPGGQVETVFADDNNTQRLVYAPVGGEVEALRLVVNGFHGSDSGVVFGFEPTLQTSKRPDPVKGERWSEVVSKVPQEELRAPDNGMEKPPEKVRVGA